MVRPPLPAELTGPRVLAILRGLGTDEAVLVAKECAAVGIGAVEVTLNSADALRTVAALVDVVPLVGAGTVLSVDDAAAAVAAGARLLVSPHTDEALVRWCADAGVPSLPGALTPTEAVTAWEAGAAGVKLFPAGAVGPGYLKDLRAPLPHIPFVPTGGVTSDSAAVWLRAGAVALGVGGWLTADVTRVAERAQLLMSSLDAP